MTAFRDRLAEAIRHWSQVSAPALADALIESGVVADPAELARAEADWRREIEARGAEVKRADRAEIELATLRQHLQEQATADDPVTVPKSDVRDPKGYLWRDQWAWAVERAEKAEARLADVWDEGAMDERWNSEHEGSIERGTRQQITNPYRAEPEETP